MKTILQSYRGGDPGLHDVPEPALLPGGVLVRNQVSLISSGTEQLMVGLAQKSLAGKARERPDLVRKVWEKLRRDGVAATLETVRSRLDAPVPLGYSSAGRVLEAGDGVGDLRAGDRVACAGAGYAHHAEVIFVPRHLAVPLPGAVPVDAAAFTTVGAIALQGLRLAGLELGETVAVIGLGLVGQLAAQLARAAGCVVLGMDLDGDRCRLAEELGAAATVTGASEFAALCHRRTGGHGVDKVIVAASARSSQPVELAADIARERAIVVVVGAVGMDIPRQPFYDKELTLRVSKSYGPGRYDPEYEEKGRDYPIGHVRWTENRNMEAFVQQLAAGTVAVEPLVSHRFAIADAGEAYELLTGKSATSHLAILLTYPPVADPVSADPARSPARDLVATGRREARKGVLRIGLVGAGQFAKGVLLPELSRLPEAELAAVCAASGPSAEHAARKFGAGFATTSVERVLADPEIDAVVIATRHHLHAGQVIAALAAGKDVFVEKPLCLTPDELGEIEDALTTAAACQGRSPVVVVGYNRRFAPMSRRLAEFLAAGEPLVMSYRVNAGYLPADHWTQDPEQGGGRILGEVCHFVDYLSFLAGAPVRRVTARGTPDGGRYRSDNLAVTLELADGSVGTLTYVASGDPALAKERIEVFGGGSAAILDNFRRLELWRGGRRRVERPRWRQDKGHRDLLAAFVASALGSEEPPIAFADQVMVSRATFAIVRSLRESSTIEV